MTDYLEIFAPLLPMVATLLTVALMPVAVFAARWLRDKLGLQALVKDEAIEAMYRGLAEDAVSYVEQFAAKLAKEGRKPSSAIKLDTAVEWIKSEAERRALPERTGEWIAALIESRLGRARPTPVAMRTAPISIAPPPIPEDAK